MEGLEKFEKQKIFSATQVHTSSKFFFSEQDLTAGHLNISRNHQ